MNLNRVQPRFAVYLFISTLFLSIPAFHSAEASVPKLITYQGILKNSSGSFLTGTYSMTFRIYSASTGGSALWTETQSSVSVTSGRFNVQLGSVTELSLAFNADYWLSVQVASDAEMTPRVRVTTAGYSYMAEDVTGGKLTGAQHAADSHMSIEGVRSAHANIAKTNFKLDAYTLASANNMGDLIVDTFNDASGIDASSSSDYTWRGSPNFDVIAGSIGGIDSNTVLMLHANGTDTSSTFTDSSSPAKNPVAVGNAQIDTAQLKFGGASGLFSGSGNYVSVADSPDWDFGTGDFTIDFWVRFNSITNPIGLVGNNRTTGGFEFYNTAGTQPTSWNMTLAGTNTSFTATTITTGVWYHYAVVRSSGTLTFYIDGIAVSNSTNNGNVTGSTANLNIGRNQADSYAFDGWLDEVRISKGVARWTTNFPPPTSEYTVPGGSTATVISTAFSQAAAFSEAMVVASPTLGTGTITYYLSRNNGTNWTQCTNEQICNLSSQPSGSQLRWKTTITGNAELDAIAVAV